MKEFRKTKVWKICSLAIIVIAAIAFAGFFICQTIENRQISKNQKRYKQAKDAGYESEFSICKKKGEVTFNGVTYTMYNAHRAAFIDGSYNEDFLIENDAKYIDRSKGKTKNLVVYGKVTGYENDPESEVVYEPGQYAVVSPYMICPYNKTIDMWAVVGLCALAGLIDMGLIAIIIIYWVYITFIKNKKVSDDIENG